ncbi:acyltransferase [Amycolatopsis thermophila]|uniref:Acetyltransferase-like isoleucine patch superfamily enzyme n=1 Tax=Amycolatopsis thermophila TaxID=206084 RepID=A0ABU0F1T3_9PSEU|nr:acyltransferase [Amycolatopsis thermophila]MDQ0381545.1 acetyltransferase-like isoleucine patch superfamily enzyme [Amycolatopsis thermophila]
MPEIELGNGIVSDAGVVIGYPPARPIATGSHLGAGARLRSGSVIYLGSRIGDRFETGHNVVIREECTVGHDVSVWSNTVIDHGCRIGDRVKIHANCYIAQFTEIAGEAFLAPGVSIANDLYPGQLASAGLMSGPSIGTGAQIGVNVTILPFVRIGAGCLIGAGAVVTRDIPAGTVAFGNPATVRGPVGELRSIESRVEAVPGSASRYRRAATRPGRPA